MMNNIVLPDEENRIDLDKGDLSDRVRLLKEQLNLTDETIAARTDPANIEAEIKGSDIDWSDYDLDQNWAHFYPRAVLKNTAQGPKWAVEVFEFVSDSKQWTNKNVGKNQEPLGLGEYLTFMVNGPERWQIGSIVPNGTSMAGIVMQRKVMITLPDPIELAQKEVIETPKEEELVKIEEESSAWVEENG